MICPECGQANAETARFCPACGTALTAVGLTARAAPPYEGGAQIPSRQDGAAIPTPAYDTAPQYAPPLQAGTDRPDAPSPSAADAMDQPGAVFADASPDSSAAHAAQTATTAQKLYGVAAGAENPFQVSPLAIPTGQPVPGGPVTLPASGMAMPAAPIPPTGAAAPHYAVSCRVCGNSFASNLSQCPRCGAPVGAIVNANDPTANSYLPVGAPAAQTLPPAPFYAPQAVANNSGQRGDTPAELPARWNWGAAFVTYFWAAAHRVWWYVGMQTLFIFAMLALWIGGTVTDQSALSAFAWLIFIFYAAVWVICRVSFGLHGNRMAWRRRHFDSIYQFVDVQEAWKPVGIVIAAIVMLCVLAFGGLFLLGAITAALVK